MNPHSLTGPNDDIPMPPLTKALDFELEVAAIIGQRVRDVSPALYARISHLMRDYAVSVRNHALRGRSGILAIIA